MRAKETDGRSSSLFTGTKSSSTQSHPISWVRPESLIKPEISIATRSPKKEFQWSDATRPPPVNRCGTTLQGHRPTDRPAGFTDGPGYSTASRQARCLAVELSAPSAPLSDLMTLTPKQCCIQSKQNQDRTGDMASKAREATLWQDPVEELRRTPYSVQALEIAGYVKIANFVWDFKNF